MQIWLATENVDFADATAASLAMLLVFMGSTLLLLSQENVKKEQITVGAIARYNCIDESDASCYFRHLAIRSFSIFSA
jgi:hypothetical protein